MTQLHRNSNEIAQRRPPQSPEEGHQSESARKPDSVSVNKLQSHSDLQIRKFNEADEALDRECGKRCNDQRWLLSRPSQYFEASFASIEDSSEFLVQETSVSEQNELVTNQIIRFEDQAEGPIGTHLSNWRR
jgi:hypothetical protein